MTDVKESATYFIHLAAEGIGPVLSGCAGVLAPGRPGSGSNTAPGTAHVKAIDFFGPRIIHRWLTELEPRALADQNQLLVRLAGLPPASSRAEAVTAIEQFGAGASPEDKSLAVEYLTAIPLAVRRSLVPDPAAGGLTLFPNVISDGEQALIRVLPTDVPPFPIGSLLPGTSYQLEELLGIGGFGAVYKSTNRFEQNQPPRAIKFCLDPAMVATLHREQAILDRLMTVGGKNWSPRIVRLYGYALDGQPPFLVYEFVPGGDLTSYLTATRQKTGRGFHPAVALELVRQIAEGLAFAHSLGLVHRDLKPANVLVSGNTIKLTDFGIGGVVASRVSRGGTLAGSMTHQSNAADQAFLFRGSGTPLYMSAEQRRGEQPDPRHDVYSLGVVWYQLLVGDVTRELNPGLADELTEEFQTPTDHIDLIQRCVGYYKKRPATAAELLPLLPPARSSDKPPTLPTGPTPETARRGRDRPPTLPKTFEQLKALLTDQIDRDVLSEVRETMSAMLKLRPQDPETLEARAYVEERLGPMVPGQLLCIADHQGWIRAVAMTADGRLAVSGGDDATLRVWDLTSGREARRMTGHTAAIMGVALGLEGRVALSAGWDGTLRLWEMATGQSLRRLEGEWKAIKCVALTPNAKTALCAGDDHLIHVWDMESGRVLRSLRGHTNLVQSVALSVDGGLAVSGGDDNSVRVWDVAKGTEIGRLAGHTDSVTSVALAANGRLAVSGSSDGTARLWDLDSSRELQKLSGHANWVNAVALAADGNRVITGSGGETVDGKFQDGDDTTVRQWDAATGKELGRWSGHQASVTCVALSTNGRRALSGSLDKTVRLWDLG